MILNFDSRESSALPQSYDLEVEDTERQKEPRSTRGGGFAQRVDLWVFSIALLRLWLALQCAGVRTWIAEWSVVVSRAFQGICGCYTADFFKVL